MVAQLAPLVLLGVAGDADDADDAGAAVATGAAGAAGAAGTAGAAGAASVAGAAGAAGDPGAAGAAGDADVFVYFVSRFTFFGLFSCFSVCFVLLCSFSQQYTALMPKDTLTYAKMVQNGGQREQKRSTKYSKTDPLVPSMCPKGILVGRSAPDLWRIGQITLIRTDPERIGSET